MSQSLSQLYVHLVFSTKDRAPVLHPEISERLHDYLAGIFDEIDSHSLKIGSATDHVHSLFALSKNLALCKAVEQNTTGGELSKTNTDDSCRSTRSRTMNATCGIEAPGAECFLSRPFRA